jgi:hypothetical protein
MVEERFEDARGGLCEVSFHGWRCVCCGNIVDPIIIKHRAGLFSTALPGLTEPSLAQAAFLYPFSLLNPETTAGS